jgi:methyl-accepting chemotaxis protein
VRNVTIRHALVGVFAVVLLLIVAVGLAGRQGARSIEQTADRLFEGSVDSTVQLNAAQNALWELRFGIANFMTGDAKRRAEIRDKENSWRQIIETNVGAYSASDRTQVERDLLVQWNEAFTGYMDARPRWFELYSAGRFAEAAEWRTNQTNKFGAIAVTTLGKLIETQQQVDVAKKSELADHRQGTEIMLFGLLAVALPIAVAAAWYLTRRIRRPLQQTVDVLHRVADGDLTARLEIRRSDEIGQVGAALNRSLDQIGDAIRSFAATTIRLDASSRTLGSASAAISGGAARTSSEAAAVAHSASEVGENIQAVAAGTDQMGTSIREIAGNAADAARVASGAVQTANNANTLVTKLGESSAEIGAVLKVITSIAEQTNLLALNATIEAARAGEAGRGFAVVAAEVKDLAQETAKATEDIRNRIEVIQTDTTGAVHAIGEITEVIGRVNDYQGTIASAVEEQTATTAEMGRLVAQVAGGAGTIRDSIVKVADAAGDAQTNVGDAERAADDLASMSSELQRLVGKFRL